MCGSGFLLIIILSCCFVCSAPHLHTRAQARSRMVPVGFAGSPFSRCMLFVLCYILISILQIYAEHEIYRPLELFSLHRHTPPTPTPLTHGCAITAMLHFVTFARIWREREQADTSFWHTLKRAIHRHTTVMPLCQHETVPYVCDRIGSAPWVTERAVLIMMAVLRHYIHIVLVFRLVSFASYWADFLSFQHADELCARSPSFSRI